MNRAILAILLPLFFLPAAPARAAEPGEHAIAIPAWFSETFLDFREDVAGIDGSQTDNSALSAGAVYVFTRSGSSWSQQAYVKASNTEAGDGFGRSPALSGDGNTLAVGANSEDSNATGIDGIQTNNLARGAGAVYVFTRSGSAWSQQAYVKASNTGAEDLFGQSVALSGDGSALAVATPNEDSSATGINGNQTDDSAVQAGAAYLYWRRSTTICPQSGPLRLRSDLFLLAP